MAAGSITQDSILADQRVGDTRDFGTASPSILVAVIQPVKDGFFGNEKMMSSIPRRVKHGAPLCEPRAVR